VVEVLKQPQYDPMAVQKQVILIFAVTNGFLDDVPVQDARRFEDELFPYVESRHPDIAKSISESGDLPDDTAEALRAAIDDFRSNFQTSEGKMLKEAEAEPLPDEEQEQEKLKRYKRKPPEERKAG
jgi:F-type H+-transporting ATPase subunit alpha